MYWSGMGERSMSHSSKMVLGWGGVWAPLSSSGSCEAQLRAPLSPAFTGQAGTREWRVVPLLWGRSPRQRDIRHRVCRIKYTPALYISFSIHLNAFPALQLKVYF